MVSRKIPKVTQTALSTLDFYFISRIYPNVFIVKHAKDTVRRYVDDNNGRVPRVWFVNDTICWMSDDNDDHAYNLPIKNVLMGRGIFS